MHNQGDFCTFLFKESHFFLLKIINQFSLLKYDIEREEFDVFFFFEEEGELLIA